MRYVEPLFRPPSEANSTILQATLGCSWNHCTYCNMYRSKQFEVRPLAETLEDIELARSSIGDTVQKVFVADGDALVMDVEHWETILSACREAFPALRQVSCYAMATNIMAKTDEELYRLKQAGLDLLYIGPESGDDVTMKRIAKGSDHAMHVEAARRAHEAGLAMSVIFLLGAGGTDRSQEHARASAELATAMNPKFLAALTLTVVDGTPIADQQASGQFELPDVEGLLRELRTFIDLARPDNALFRTNHASNYLPIGGSLPRDREQLVAMIDEALEGNLALRPEHFRGL